MREKVAYFVERHLTSTLSLLEELLVISYIKRFHIVNKLVVSYDTTLHVRPEALAFTHVASCCLAFRCF